MGRPRKNETALRQQNANLTARIGALEEVLKADSAERERFMKAAGAMAGGLTLAKEYVLQTLKNPDLARWQKFVLVSLNSWLDGALKAGHDSGLT